MEAKHDKGHKQISSSYKIYIYIVHVSTMKYMNVLAHHIERIYKEKIKENCFEFMG